MSGAVALSQEHEQKQQVQMPVSTALQARFNRGLALYQQGKLAEAERTYQEILQQDPTHFDALHLLGIIALQTRRPERGVELITKAIALNPNVAAAHNNLGSGLNDLKRHEEALASFDRAIALKADYAEAYNNRGPPLIALNRHDQALASYDKAIELKPDYAKAYYNRGTVLSELTRYEEALASYNKAVMLKPDYAEAHNNRGVVLNDLKRHQQAVASCDRAIALKPDLAEAHFNRGTALNYLKQFDDAFAAFDKAFALKSDLIGAEGDRLHAKMQLCDWSNFDSECAHLISSVSHGHANTPPFAFLAIASTSAEQLQCAKLLVANKAALSDTRSWSGDRYRHDRIRVAYLSGDFRDHPVAYSLVGVFEQHNRKRFETVAISFGPDQPSDLSKRLKGAFDRFIDVDGRSDVDVARLLKELEVDIAVDLMGYTANSRISILAHRPSAIQASFLGYAGTIGARYVDYLIADRTLIPESSRPYYTEKIVYLPNTYMPNDSKRLISDQALDRADFGLPQSGFVFCCFNNSFKLNPGVFGCWMRILKKVKASVLWLSETNATAVANLKKEAEIRGINPDRLIFATRMPSLAVHLARHRLADLFLDTLPYNAHATASDALWAGLPVLTQIGETFAGRVAASQLTAVGLPELIAATPQAYEELAVELAGNPANLAAVKRKLEINRLTAPLFDTKLFTKHIEVALTAMHERHQADLPPDHIYVPQ